MTRTTHDFIDRLCKRSTPKEVARDRWMWLRKVLKDARYSCDDDHAAMLARQLAYLCTRYNTDSVNDPFQGMNLP